MLWEKRTLSRWRGATAVALVAAGTAIAALYGVLAVCLLSKEK